MVDGLLVGFLSAAAVGQLLYEGPADPWRLPPVLGTIVPLAWRGRYPLVTYGIQFGAALLSRRIPTVATLVAIFIGLYAIGVHSHWRLRSLVAPLGSALVLQLLFPDSPPPLTSGATMLLGGGAVWLAGNAIRDRQARAETLEERAAQLEREQVLELRVVLADERARIARELHDVGAHRVSVMVVQAGAARMLLGRQPERAGEPLLAVEASGREALGELRRLLGLLTNDEHEPELAPQPGLAQLDRLVERVGQAGLPVVVRRVGTARTLPPGLDLTAYRVIQEALTNALKYARGTPTEILIEHGERELRLEIQDAGGATAVDVNGTGRGLLGMRERVALYGGHLEAGHRPEGGFAVRARLPLQPV
jgi:signal transduction histidine kinase